MDAAWELYSFCMNPPDKSPKQFLYASSRATQKTLLLAAVETVLAIHSRRPIVHFAAAREQVKPAKKYMVEFSQRPYIRELLKSDPTSVNIIYLVPESDNELWLKGWNAIEIQKGREDSTGLHAGRPDSLREVEIELAGISGATTQGKHTSIVSVDEVSSLKGEKISFYNDIKKVPIASHDGKPYVVFKISTRRGAYSVVEKEISEASKTGLNVRRWTVLEGVEKCPDERSGTDFIHQRYVSVTQGQCSTEEEYVNLEDKKKKDFEVTALATKCLSCPLRVVCRGDLKKQRSKSKHLQPIDAAIVEYASSDRDFYNSQCLSLMPTKEGLVLSRFDEDLHVVSADEMFQIFTGSKPPRAINPDQLINLFRSKGLKFYAGIDWGFTDPTAIVVVATDGERAFTLYAMSRSNMEVVKDVVPILKQLEARFGKLVYFPDTARPDNNATLISLGFAVDDAFDKGTIDSGITQIRTLLSPNIGSPRMYLLKGETDPLVDEVKKYHYLANTDGTISDDIADEFNHLIDAWRYLIINVFGGGQKVIMTIENTDPDGLSASGLMSNSPFSSNTGVGDGISVRSTVSGGNGFVFNFGDDLDD
jgi:hypothetical protein